MRQSQGIRAIIDGVIHELYDLDEDEEWGDLPWRIRYADYPKNLQFYKIDPNKLFWIPISRI